MISMQKTTKVSYIFRLHKIIRKSLFIYNTGKGCTCMTKAQVSEQFEKIKGETDKC